jgi:hypothetical protein
MLRLLLLAVLACLSTPALAWGYEGHEVVALIARAQLTPAVRAKVDAILAADTDTLTQPDMVSRATWADAWRSHGHRETARWHFVDTELDSPDLKAACFGVPAAEQPASAGPAQDCVVDKVREFTAELGDPATAVPERLLALKYLLHFVGDLHQPLHASDNHDRGGNCVLVSLGGQRTVNLHSYWDTGVVQAIGTDPAAVAGQLGAATTPAQRASWETGDPAAWAQEAFGVARDVVYSLRSPPGCGQDAAPIPLPEGYEARAKAAATIQLQKAGVRLAMLLNRALATVPVGVAPTSGSPIPPSSAPTGGRSAASLACSAQADQRDLHGAPRQRFRRSCMKRYPQTGG